MKVFNSIEEFALINDKQSIITIGSFDGVHKGHSIILKQTSTIAKEQNLYSIVLSFEPHPKEILKKDRIFNDYLMSKDEKIDAINDYNIDAIIIHPFNYELSKLDADSFLAKLLIAKLKMKYLIVGEDHTFGNNREGNVSWLRNQTKKHAFSLCTCHKHSINSNSISSTYIRNLISKGNVYEAKRYLGYPYHVTGTVIHGQKIGNKISFPTANIKPLYSKKLIPKNGVYHILIKVKNESFEGIANIGIRPTFNNDGKKTHIEVHIFNFSRYIYDELITIYFIGYIREEKKFTNLEELKEQINKDIKSVKSTNYEREYIKKTNKI